MLKGRMVQCREEIGCKIRQDRINKIRDMILEIQSPTPTDVIVQNRSKRVQNIADTFATLSVTRLATTVTMRSPSSPSVDRRVMLMRLS